MPAVEESINDLRSFIDANHERFDFWESPHDVEPMFALHDAIVQHHYVGYIDWRSFPDETHDRAAPMFTKKGTCNFDRSFIEEFMDDDESTGNDRLLKIVAQKASYLLGDHPFIWMYMA